MRLHAEPDSKLYARGPHWRFCDDPSCLWGHVEWEPFRPIVSDIDLSHLEPAKWEGGR